MAQQLFTNNASSTLASGISNVATSLTLATGQGALFPNPTGGDWFLLTLTQAAVETSWEIVKVTARATDTLTIVRAQEGTTAAAWATADKAEARLTAGSLDGKQPAMTAATQAEMEAGTETALRSMTPQRVKQAITALAGSISVSGSASATTSAVSTYTILAPDSFTTYSVSAASGTASLSGATITYTAPGSACTDTLTISGGGATKAITITVAAPTYYIATPAATPANFADPFEGGFYTGKVWNELVQSSTSTAISTGAKTFTVPDMASVPIIYNGQSLEVRSRANPANKMIGTVTGTPTSTTIGFNCTSVGGSGTFTDWSIMATYRIISAPKSSGENASIAYKNANTAAPTACQTVTEGYKAMLAMVAADTSTVYPLAWWCKGLTIGGKADWYPPARDEEELQWRNLKPTADNNYTGTRSKSAIAYGNLGSIDDGATDGYGVNNNSNPPGSAYTTTVPAQVAAGKNFRTGESEAFAYGSCYYWSASEYSTSLAWFQYWVSGAPGTQDTNGKSYAFYVRAVRRSII